MAVLICPECSASHEGPCGTRVFIEAKCPVCEDYDRPFVCLPCGHGVCIQHFQDLDGTLSGEPRPDPSIVLEKPGAIANCIEYIDANGDAIKLMLNAEGRLDYLVNQRTRVRNLAKLEAEDSTLHLSGTATGRWSGERRSTIPSDQVGILEKAVALFQRSSQEPPMRWWESVEYIDANGDNIKFELNSYDLLDFLVNGGMKVKNLSKLEARDSTLYLDGTSAGNWGSVRSTTVPLGQQHILNDALALFARSSRGQGMNPRGL
mmetsp:Transcript_144334/g.269065  ORF Transcript_144334/g.269065 Transcript_144334/m.269065 type:complete len:262 (-) Transcript_144334:104-889(-)